MKKKFGKKNYDFFGEKNPFETKFFEEKSFLVKYIFW